MRAIVICLLLMMVSLKTDVGWATVDTEIRGEAALSTIVSDPKPRSLHVALRYVPELMARTNLGGTRELTALAAFDATWQSRIVSLDNATSDDKIEVYRLWLRYGANNFELRVGRQKLSFGSATLLRPLMWFDSIDPRDPLQITDGVNAALARFYLLNNANLWLWGLYDNEEPVGWEIVPTARETAEYGGRLQWPAGNGEIAFSYHHRRADYASLAPAAVPAPVDSRTSEDRFGLDGKWDMILGLWFEAVLSHQHDPLAGLPYRRFGSVGADYTFGVGQGLTFLVEHLFLGSSEEPLGRSSTSNYSAASLQWPWGVVDDFNLILYKDWDENELYSFLEWRRTYDRWSLHLMAFANPEEAGSSPIMPGSELLAGRGLRALVVFNH